MILEALGPWDVNPSEPTSLDGYQGAVVDGETSYGPVHAKTSVLLSISLTCARANCPCYQLVHHDVSQ